MNDYWLESGRKLVFRDEGSGPPLILLHGWSMSSAVFSAIVPGLASSFRVLAPDLPGHGDSDPGPPDYRFAEVAAELSEWLLGLGVQKGSLLGWSMGGQIGMELECLGRPLIEKQILVSTTPRFANGGGWTFGQPPTQIKAMKRNLERDCLGTAEQFFRLQFDGEELPPESIDQMASLALGKNPNPDPETLATALVSLGREDQRDLLKDLSMPCLAVHGKQDRIVPWEAGKYLAENLQNSRLEIFERLGHAPFLSRPMEMIDLWLDFLS